MNKKYYLKILARLSAPPVLFWHSPQLHLKVYFPCVAEFAAQSGKTPMSILNTTLPQ